MILRLVSDSAAHPHLSDAINAPYTAAARRLASEDAAEGPRAFAHAARPGTLKIQLEVTPA